MKKPFLAFLLSFFLPGAGLAYLGMWRPALLNFAIVLVIGFALAFLLPPDVFERYIRFVAFGAAGGSGALARQLAIEQNAKQSTPTP